MRPSVFIGSSVEGRRIAELMQLQLESEADCVLWTQGMFVPGNSFLEDLTARLNDFDFAVLVLSPDDDVVKRTKPGVAPRDNVIFEAGLFIGSIGRERTLLLRPGDIENFTLFSDYQGITTVNFDHERVQRDGQSALGSAATLIKEQIRKHGVRFPFRRLGLSLKDIGDFYEQTGLTYAYGARKEAGERMLLDVSEASRSVRMYSRVYITELLKDRAGFQKALLRAAGNARTEEILIVHTSTDSKDEELARLTWLQEDPKRQFYDDLPTYQHHLRKSDVHFENLHSDLTSCLEQEARPRLRFERRYLVGSVLPYSVVVIDDRILYVSFYSMSPTRTGTYAPTMRLVCEDGDGETWGTFFLRFADEVDEELSRHGRSLGSI